MKTTIKLKFPIEFNGLKIDTLEMRRCNAGDREQAELAGKTDAAREIALFSSLTETEPGAIRKLDLADYVQLQETFQSFLS